MELSERIPPIGLVNNSYNGCYVNSCIQLLFSMKSFVSYLSFNSPSNEILQRIRLLFVDLISTTLQSINTFYFLDCYNPQYGDPNEFLTQILEHCNQCGYYEMSIRCDINCDCGKTDTVISKEPVLLIRNNGIQLDLPTQLCLSLFREFHCSCGRTLNVELKPLNSPQYLIICVENIKIINNQIEKQTKSISQNKEIIYNKSNYSLKSMITHINGYDNGHCKSYVKTQSGWYCCDDTNVYPWNEKLEEEVNEVVTTFLFEKKEEEPQSKPILSQQALLDYYLFLKRKQNNSNYS
ncbi:hypothetical protein EDI_201800 [Entamoeba dispar SAW760]|uniref:USP domain-containing protein n=1 Tax=Entamoeba dispar (strain ATCC PRA-260 / SAW760) TaxID=370354 RepID=B0ETX5_ENTDS|nr:uncharacterized protein EDI_201800 [Entamoeba dispar SAW760]EDR22063.1 hypothetical protein EDI_201800 [Entamoeba dispar SAW760]|eukprot:EDR22063.1 hypothetical protein EDI_201800 [Entamoeba dispar SAW760]